MKQEKRMRKLLCITSLLLALLLSACGTSAENSPPEETAEQSPEATIVPVVETPMLPTPEPLPELPDIDINSWEYVLCNSNNSLSSYQAQNVGWFGGQGIDARIASYAQDFRTAASSAGFNLYVGAGNRSHEYLISAYSAKIDEYGSAAEAAKEFLPPGVNEHQTGLAFDFTDKADYTAMYHQFAKDSLEDDECLQWLKENCAEYGFILRYPEDKAEFYGSPCCRSHFRYVGVEAARYIMENDLCLEEFIMLYDADAVYIPEK